MTAPTYRARTADTFRIRRMTPADASEAAALECVCFTDGWSEASYRATLLLPYAVYFAAVEPSGRMIGTIGLQNLGGDGEISNVAVLPEYRCRGIAHELMEQALEAGHAGGITRFTLEVRSGNTAARALYDSFDFVEKGRRKDFYTGPVEDALILWRIEDTQEARPAEEPRC